ncbi:MAG: HEAT repeat domain-containing protein [Planctomycetes bacterium]|nr:HEAT repeat domain-containing protein [Planctomycetota bacterium]
MPTLHPRLPHVADPVLVALVFVALVLVAMGPGIAPAESEPAQPTQHELMAKRGLIRYRGAWRTVQEIDLIERNERFSLAQREWSRRLERLRREADDLGSGDRAAEEIRELADPAAVSALAAAIVKEPSPTVRGWYVEALARIPSPDAARVLVSIALDHADPETRITACERLASTMPQAALPTLTAALRSADNGQVNRAAEALARLDRQEAVGPLIDALTTRHIVGADAPEGQMSATFTPSGGGMAMGGGPKRSLVDARNAAVLEALVTLTGANFEWDAAAWRRWLAARNAPPADFDPRRG